MSTDNVNAMVDNDKQILNQNRNLHYVIQGSYRQVWVKFKHFSRTSKDFSTVFKD